MIKHELYPFTVDIFFKSGILINLDLSKSITINSAFDNTKKEIMKYMRFRSQIFPDCYWFCKINVHK